MVKPVMARKRGGKTRAAREQFPKPNPADGYDCVECAAHGKKIPAIGFQRGLSVCAEHS